MSLNNPESANNPPVSLPAPARLFPVQKSLLQPAALLQEIAGAYANLPPLLDCTLIRSYVNDVYRLRSAEADFILKVYRAGLRSLEEIYFEMQVLEHLTTKGVPVSNSIVRSDGNKVGVLAAPEGVRYYVVFEFAPGEKPQPPFTPTLYYHEGQAAARMHNALDSFSSSYSRFSLDFTYLLDRPLQHIQSLLANQPENWDFLNRLSAAVKKKITTLSEQGLTWGVCHGDMTLDNLHVTENNDITFYDFDFCAYGWRAYEPNGLYKYSWEEKNGVWEAFLKGYNEIGHFKAADLEAVPWFNVANEIWILGYDASIAIQDNGTYWVSQNYLKKQLTKWRSWAQEQLHITL